MNLSNFSKILRYSIIVSLLVLLLVPEEALSRRGRSFGGSRRSTKTYRTKPSTKSRTKSPAARTRSLPASKRTSFGGSRMTKSQAQQKYGTPRKTQTIQGKNAAGQPQRYVANSYGGYGSSLMMGYMMGSTSWMWMMPFHPAFYYSRPNYVQNEDGTMSVYPPTFSFGRLLMVLIVLAIVIFIIRAIIKRRKQNRGGGDNPSLSSFS